MPRLGVLGFAIAVFIVLGFMANKGTPEFRVIMSYAASLIMMIAGWRLKNTYPMYSRVLYGGGLAVAYFVTFAMYFVGPAKILDHPGLSLAGMGGIVVVWALIA